MSWKDFIEFVVRPILVQHNRETLPLNLTLASVLEQPTLAKSAELTVEINNYLRKFNYV